MILAKVAKFVVECAAVLFVETHPGMWVTGTILLKLFFVFKAIRLGIASDEISCQV